MNKRSLVVLVLVLCVGVGVVEVSRRGSQSGADSKQADAAYRDGSFQAKIDIESGRKPHFSSGRWSTDQDRASFIVATSKPIESWPKPAPERSWNRRRLSSPASGTGSRWRPGSARCATFPGQQDGQLPQGGSRLRGNEY